MPGHDLRSYHDEFIDDEDGEAHADHARELCVGATHEDLAEALDDAALVNTDSDPDEEGSVTETLAIRQFLVEFRVEIRQSFIDIFIEHEAEHRSHGVYGRVAHEQPIAVEGNGFVVRSDAVDGLADGYDETAVDDELRQFRRTLVRVPAVPNEEFGEVVEAGY